MQSPTTVDVEEGLIDESSRGEFRTKEERKRRCLQRPSRPFVVSGLVVLIGMAGACAFLGRSIRSAYQNEEDNFQQASSQLFKELRSAFDAYEFATLWVHQASNYRRISHEEFRGLYEHLIAMGIDARQVEFFPNVSRAERESYEDDAREYYAREYEDFDYRGFLGFEAGNSTADPMYLGPRSEQDFYFPAHYVEPIAGSEHIIDIDGYSASFFRPILDATLTTMQPTMTGRTKLFEETLEDMYAVFLLHPGVSISTVPDSRPRGVAMLVIRVFDLLQRATKKLERMATVRIYDNSAFGSDKPEFLGGVRVDPDKGMVYSLTEVEVDDLPSSRYRLTETMKMANREWIVATCATDDTYDPDLLYLILGGISIFLASLCIAVSIYVYMQRATKLNQVRSAAQAEKAALILSSAKEAAVRERTLNDYIAHEVGFFNVLD